MASLLTVAGTLGAHEAGGHGQLRGQVVDETQGGPIAGVPVRVAGTELSALTDEHGTFVFPSVPAGPLVLLVDGPVVAPVRLTLAEPRPTGPLVITAAYAATAEVDVTVTGARPAPTAASTRRLTRHELQAAPRRTAEDALRLVPGLTVVQHGSEGKGHQFFLRGFDAVHGADLALSVGGAPVNEWSNIHAQGYVDLGFVIPEIVDSVTVIKGPFSLDQGAFAMAGSADYELGVAAEDRGLRTSFGVGTTYRHRSLISYSPRRGNGRDFVASEVVHDDGFGQRRHIDRVGLLGQHRLLDAPRQGTLTLMTAASLARFELPGTVRNDDVEAGRIGFYDAYDHQSRGLSGRGLVALSYRWEGDGHQVRATVHGGIRRLELRENYTGYLVDPIHGDARAQQQDAHQLGARFAYDTDLHPAVALQVGGGFRGDMLDQRQDHVDRLGTPLERDRELSGHQSITHGRAGLEVGPLRALRLVGGARVDVAHVDVRDGLADDASQGGTRVAVSPRAIALWRVMDGWSLSAAYGRGFRPPEARAFTGHQPAATGMAAERYSGGAPAMTLSDAAEVGTRLSPGPCCSFRWSGFATFIERESVFDHVSGLNLELNATRRVGTELDVHIHPLDWLGLNADVTYVDARFVESGNPIPLAPWLVGSLGGTVDHSSGLFGGLRFLAMAARHLPHAAQGAPLAVLDGTLAYRWEGFRVALEVENLLNLEIREGEYHYASHWRRDGAASQLPVLHYVAAPPLNARLTLTAVQ